MRDNLHLTPIDLLPPVIPEDNEFVSRISDEFNLPLDELCWLIRDLRTNLQDTEFEEIISDEYKTNYYEKLEHLDFDPKDPLSQILYKQIKRMRIEIRGKKEIDDKFILRLKKSSIYLKILLFLSQSELIKIKRHVVFGLFIVHLKFKSYYTRKVWEDKRPTQDDTWENYMYGRVKTLLKKYASEITL